MASLAELLGRSAAPAQDPNAANFDAMGSVTMPAGAAVGRNATRPNWVMEPTLEQANLGGWLPPGASTDDAGRPVYPDTGENIQIIRRPGVLPLVATPDGPQFVSPKIADLLGGIVGGGAPSGALRAGYGPVERSVLASDPTVVERLAQHIDASAKRVLPRPQMPEGGFYVPPVTDEAALAHMDNSLGALSFAPSKNAMGKAERALDMGLDTPAFHITGAKYVDPAAIKKSSPFLEMDPFIANRGAMYFGDSPSGIWKSGAAQVSGEPRGFGFVLGRNILGDSALPSALHEAAPASVQFQHGQPITNELLEVMRSQPGYKDAMAAAREEAQRYYTNSPGNMFDATHYGAGVNNAEHTVAEQLARIYYSDPGYKGAGNLISREGFTPVSASQAEALPKWQEFEAGARRTQPGNVGVHSPMQNVINSLGFSGSRERDEMQKVLGSTYAMTDPAAVRAVGAQFKDPFGNLVSARVPAGAVFSQPNAQSEARQ